MGRRQKTASEGLKVTFEALGGRRNGGRIFGIEDEANEEARQAKLRRMAERIAEYGRGCEGGRRRCPRCGKWQTYKGERAREVAVDGGTLTVQRAYYVCPFRGETSYPPECGADALQHLSRPRALYWVRGRRERRGANYRPTY